MPWIVRRGNPLRSPAVCKKSNEWRVTPEMLLAALPVNAATTHRRLYSRTSIRIPRIRKDLPVPLYEYFNYNLVNMFFYVKLFIQNTSKSLNSK